MDIQLKFSFVYHPQTDGQTKVVNRSLDSLLHCLVREHHRSWDTILSTTEFFYNSSVNRITSMNPFEIVTSYKPRVPIDLIPMLATHRPSESTSTFVQHIHSLHEELRRKIILSNDPRNYMHIIQGLCY